jgi:hypothetical protein
MTKYLCLWILAAWAAFPAVLWAEEGRIDRLEKELAALKKQVQDLKNKGAEEEEELDLAALRRLADEEASKEQKEEKKSGRTVFKSGGLALQTLNPEISVTGDILYTWTYEEGETHRMGRGDFVFRGVGLHIEGYLDPYTRFKAAVPVNAGGAAIGEAYMTRYAVWEGLNITAGKFRQQFGIINRWHKHGLDQVDFPLALRMIFGGGGLNQIGLSFEQKLPAMWTSSQDVVLQVTNGENPALFDGNVLSTPAILARYRNYFDLTPSTYFEIGLTGLVGWKDAWRVNYGSGPVTENRSLWSVASCIDATLSYEPTSAMRHFRLEWRTELYFLNREILAPDGSGRDLINAWGFTSILHAKLSRTWEAGAQVGFYEPDFKMYAATPGLSLSPHATDNPNSFKVHGAVYVTWWQSPFVRFHLQYDYLGGNRSMGIPEHSVTAQVVFAVGPHKHERY